MTEAEQFDFDFQKAEKERPLMEHFARLERIHREEWTEENLCIAWVTESDGRAWRDWWPMQPCYERERMLAMYRAERNFAEFSGKMRPYALLIPSKEELDLDRHLIEFFKSEIRSAALDGRPMPLRPSSDMSPLEVLTFRRRLLQAMTEAGVVIVPANQENAA
jgi:hypothetical protein